MPAKPTRPAPPPLSALLAQGPLALFVDFDGTLVEIAPSPDAIVVPGSLARRLVALAATLDGRLALVSGRGIDDIERHCGALAVALAGSHGAALRTADGKGCGTGPAPIPAQIVAEVEAFALREAVGFERKPHGAALHSRAAPHREADCLSFMTGLAELHGLTAKPGKRVVELVHPGADKGTAVELFMAEAPFNGAMPVFIGDDVTDEDGFAACTRLGGFGIAVGERSSDHAAFFLSGPQAVHSWLRL